MLGTAQDGSMFPVSTTGLRALEDWILRRSGRVDHLEIFCWRGFEAAGLTELEVRIERGLFLKRPFWSPRRFGGILSVQITGYPTASELSRRFGYPLVNIEAAVRSAGGEFPSPLESATSSDA